MDTCHVIQREALEVARNDNLKVAKASMPIESMFKIEVKAQEVINDVDLAKDDKYVEHIRLCNDLIESSSPELVT